MDKKIKMVKYSARQTNIIFNAKIQIVFCESELWTIIGFLYQGEREMEGKVEQNPQQRRTPSDENRCQSYF